MMPPPTTTWYYDPRTRRYHDNVTHRFLAFATVEGLMEKSLGAFHKEADALSALIADKAIPIGEWEAGMRNIIQRSYEANCILARGGLAQVTDEDRAKVSEFLEFQFERLDRFAGQIVDEHWTARGGAIHRRAKMYVNSGRQIFWYIETQNQKEIGGKWERWVLIGGTGDGGTCADCVALSAKGWVEIGTLPQPCDGSTACLSSCRCGKRYSKAKKRPRARGALHAFLKTALELMVLERLGFSPKPQGRSYPAPHCGAPGEVGGSRPREECAPGGQEEKAESPFAGAPMTRRGATAWRRKMQKLYDTDPEFRDAVDAIVLYTHGSYGVVREACLRESTGVIDDEGYNDSLLTRNWDKKLNHLSHPLGEYPSMFEGQDVGGKTEGTVKDGAAALNAMLDTAPEIDEGLFRGVNRDLRRERDENWEISKIHAPHIPSVGDEFEMKGPTSFTSDEYLAILFSESQAKGQSKRGREPDYRIVYEVGPGARGLPVAALSKWKQEEVLTTGRFKVVSLRWGKDEFSTPPPDLRYGATVPRRGAYRITLEWIGHVTKD